MCSVILDLVPAGGAWLDEEDPQIILVHRMAHGDQGRAEAAWKALADRHRVAGISALPVLFPFLPF